MKNTADGWKVTSGPKIVVSEMQASADFEMEANRKVYRQLIGATIQNKLVAFFKGFALDRHIHLHTDESGQILLKLPDETVLNEAGYKKEDIIKVLNDFLNGNNLQDILKSNGDVYARTIQKGGIEITDTSKRDDMFVHGADVVHDELYAEVLRRTSLKPESKDNLLLIIVSDKSGNVSINGVQAAVITEDMQNSQQAEVAPVPLPMRAAEAEAITDVTISSVLKFYQELLKKKQEAEKEAQKQAQKDKETISKALNASMEKKTKPVLSLPPQPTNEKDALIKKITDTIFCIRFEAKKKDRFLEPFMAVFSIKEEMTKEEQVQFLQDRPRMNEALSNIDSASLKQFSDFLDEMKGSFPKRHDGIKTLEAEEEARKNGQFIEEGNSLGETLEQLKPEPFIPPRQAIARPIENPYAAAPEPALSPVSTTRSAFPNRTLLSPEAISSFTEPFSEEILPELQDHSQDQSPSIRSMQSAKDSVIKKDELDDEDIIFQMPHH